MTSLKGKTLFVSGGSTTPVTGGFVCEVLVGSRYTFWKGNPFALQSVRIRGTGTTSPTPPTPGPDPTPPDHFIVPDAQGWVTIDQMALDDGFNGWLMGFSSPVAFPGGGAAPAGLLAGSRGGGTEFSDGYIGGRRRLGLSLRQAAQHLHDDRVDDHRRDDRDAGPKDVGEIGGERAEQS